MTDPEVVIDRIATGFYADTNPLIMHEDFCGVLQASIHCFDETAFQPAGTPDTCSNLWSFDQCFHSISRNATVEQNCPKSSMEEDVGHASNHFSTYCNVSTGLWETQKRCTHNEHEAYTVGAAFNQSYDVGGEIDEFDMNKMRFYLTELKSYELIQRLVTFGYVISLASLVMAISLFVLLKRLHCTRIFVHMNLMVAFMLRGLVWILHVTAFEDSDLAEQKIAVATLQLGKNVFGQFGLSDLPQLMEWKRELCDPYDDNSYYARCRFYFVILNYSVTANYYWLLVEGIYLALLLRAKYPNRNNKMHMRVFLVLGWVAPWLSVIGGVTANLLDATKVSTCWFVSKIKTADWFLINIPILTSVLINFVIFILVIKAVGSKLRGDHRHFTDESHEDYKWRLAKSTLALVPLLGIQYLFTVFFDLFQINDKTWEVTKQAFELIFASIQGFLVALIYCFLNGEIQDECKRYWRSLKTEWELKFRSRSKRRRTYHTSMMTIDTTLSRKASAISTASTKRSDSVFTMGRTAGGDGSPKNWRHNSTLDGILEQSPATETRGTVQRNNSTDASRAGGSVSRNASVGTSSNNLLVPGWERPCRRQTSSKRSRSSSLDPESVFEFDEERLNLISHPNGNEATHQKSFKTSII